MIVMAGRGTSTGARLIGGGQLTRLVRGQSNPIAFARAATKVIRRRVLPALRQRLPRVTGELRRNMRIVQRGDAVEVRGISYAPTVRFSRGPGARRTVAGEAHAELRRQLAQVGRGINAELLRG